MTISHDKSVSTRDAERLLDSVYRLLSTAFTSTYDLTVLVAAAACDGFEYFKLAPL
jgi:hypothetical protein